MNRFLSFILLILGMALLGVPGNAQAQLIIQKSVIKHEMSPGSGTVDSLEVTNSTNKPLAVKLYWQDFIYRQPFNKGNKEFMPSGTSDYSCANMITFSPNTIALPPFGKQEVKYSVKVPESFKTGCDGVLFFEMSPDVAKARIGMSFVTRIGTLFFLESTEANKSATVEDMALNGGSLLGNFYNQGDVVLFPKGVFFFLSEDGLVEDRGEVNKLYVPPQAKADFQLVVPETIPPGKHTVVLTFDLESGDSVVIEVDFNKNPEGTMTLVATRD
ncbi:MAG: hypothetical protein WC450_10615 [Candidatus Omnitrophota bacterium]